MAFGAIAAVRDQIHFREARSVHVPAIGLNGNVVLENVTGPGAAVDSAYRLASLRLETAIDSRGADLAQKVFFRRCDAQFLASDRHPFKQRDFQPASARVAR